MFESLSLLKRETRNVYDRVAFIARELIHSELFLCYFSDKTPSEEDWYCHLPPEKFMQYKVILAEINRKITTQTFKPDD